MSIVYLTSDIILCSTIFYMREIIDINCFALPIPPLTWSTFSCGATTL